MLCQRASVLFFRSELGGGLKSDIMSETSSCCTAQYSPENKLGSKTCGEVIQRQPQVQLSAESLGSLADVDTFLHQILKYLGFSTFTEGSANLSKLRTCYGKSDFMKFSLSLKLRYCLGISSFQVNINLGHFKMSPFDAWESLSKRKEEMTHDCCCAM